MGTLHEFSRDGATARLLKRAFRELPIRRVVVEGRPSGAGDVLADEVPSVEAEGERAVALLEAAARGVPALGGEPSDQDIAAALLAAGFGPEDILGQMMVAWLPLWRRQGTLSTESLPRLLERELEPQRKAYGLPDFRFSPADFVAWYQRANGEPFDLEAISADFERSRPARDGTFLTQRMSHVSSLVRNRHIARVLSSELARYGNVLAVFGTGHLAAQWAALEAAFGPALP